MCHREGGGIEVVALWNSPSTLHILDLLSTPNSSTGTQDGKHRMWEVFSLSGPPHPPRGGLSFTMGSRHPGGAGMHQTGKEQEGTGEDILSRGSGSAHTTPKSFLHGKLVKYPSHQLPPHFQICHSPLEGWG